MNGQLRLNVILPIVLLAALAAAVALFMLSRGPSTPTTEPELAPLPRPTHVPVAPSAKPKTAPKPAAAPAAAKPKPQTRPAVKPVARPKPKVKLKEGLPPALNRALTARPVAVVSFVTPGAGLDELAAKEAAAGANAVGASFVTVDVGKERQARPYAVMLGALDAPTVLVFKRPGELFVRLNGFADLDTVAQAADNATP
jgi:hypothetical protein